MLQTMINSSLESSPGQVQDSPFDKSDNTNMHTEDSRNQAEVDHVEEKKDDDIDIEKGEAKAVEAKPSDSTKNKRNGEFAQVHVVVTPMPEGALQDKKQNDMDVEKFDEGKESDVEANPSDSNRNKRKAEFAEEDLVTLVRQGDLEEEKRDDMDIGEFGNGEEMPQPPAESSAVKEGKSDDEGNQNLESPEKWKEASLMDVRQSLASLLEAQQSCEKPKEKSVAETQLVILRKPTEERPLKRRKVVLRTGAAVVAVATLFCATPSVTNKTAFHVAHEQHAFPITLNEFVSSIGLPNRPVTLSEVREAKATEDWTWNRSVIHGSEVMEALPEFRFGWLTLNRKLGMRETKETEYSTCSLSAISPIAAVEPPPLNRALQAATLRKVCEELALEDSAWCPIMRTGNVSEATQPKKVEQALKIELETPQIPSNKSGVQKNEKATDESIFEISLQEKRSPSAVLPLSALVSPWVMQREVLSSVPFGDKAVAEVNVGMGPPGQLSLKWFARKFKNAAAGAADVLAASSPMNLYG